MADVDEQRELLAATFYIIQKVDEKYIDRSDWWGGGGEPMPSC